MNFSILHYFSLINLYYSQLLIDGTYKFENVGNRGKFLGISSAKAETSELSVISKDSSKSTLLDWDLNHGKEGWLIKSKTTGEYLGVKNGKLSLDTDLPLAWSIRLDKENRYTILNYRDQNKVTIEGTNSYYKLVLTPDIGFSPASQWLIHKQ